MIPKDLKQRIEKLYINHKRILSCLKNDDINNLYLLLYEDFNKIQSIPNSTVLHYIRRKDVGSNLELKMDLEELYKIAKTNQEKISVFLEYEDFFKDDENFV